MTVARDGRRAARRVPDQAQYVPRPCSPPSHRDRARRRTPRRTRAESGRAARAVYERLSSARSASPGPGGAGQLNIAGSRAEARPRSRADGSSSIARTFMEGRWPRPSLAELVRWREARLSPRVGAGPSQRTVPGPCPMRTARGSHLPGPLHSIHEGIETEGGPKGGPRPGGGGNAGIAISVDDDASVVHRRCRLIRSFGLSRRGVASVRGVLGSAPRAAGGDAALAWCLTCACPAWTASQVQRPRLAERVRPRGSRSSS
jgi:hypothetical protein